MTTMNQLPLSRSRRTPLRLGFVPVTDCAPLVMAQELGYFRDFGLEVTLSRELGWATIRDKIVFGELDAAQAVVGLPVAATLGIGSVRCECVTALVLNLNGNGLTLSNELRTRGVTDAAKLRAEIVKSRRQRMFTFGIVSPVASHNFLLRNWLAAAGIHPDRDVRIVVVPPPQMAANLKSGNLDGFCAGEPWNSVAVQTRAGWCAAVSAELDRGHPEKVLMVRREFAEKRGQEHLALVAALIAACKYCDTPENRNRLVTTLARAEYVGASTLALRAGITGQFDFGRGTIRAVPDFTVFHRDGANEPSCDKAAWVLQRMGDAGLCKGAGMDLQLARRVFRADLYFQASEQMEAIPRHEAEPNSKTELVLH
jgi:ABC-type nitrate/sulfonate/bicarbonate transport system substrate-binding protein